MRKKTTSEWVEQAKNKHPGMYDYSLSVYTGASNKLTITCPTHGPFEQTAHNHLQGAGCPSCADKKKGAYQAVSLPEFLARAQAFHGDRYEYDKASYSGISKPVKIMCVEHGAFTQIAGVHARGHGCPACALVKNAEANRLSQEEFVSRANTTHGGVYDYSEAVYVRNDLAVKIVCQEHGSFLKTPANHLKGQGCPECAKRDAVLGNEEFIRRSVLIHGDTYDYSLVTYVLSDVEVEIICKEHGPFLQTPHSHMKGSGCPTCSLVTRTSNTDEFICKAREVHGSKFDYRLVDYKHCEQHVEIVCPTHGSFHQTPSNHVNQKTGCPSCANVGPSRGQIDLAEYLSTLTDVVLEHPVGRKRIDIYLPEFNIGVEYHGLVWHSEKFAREPWRDMYRHQEMQSSGIRLIHVFEDEWKEKRLVVEKTLRSILGKNTKIGARACEVVRPSWKDARAFLKDNHLQGAGISRGMNYGLSVNGSLVAVATFGPSRFGVGDWELLRFASSSTVVGGFSRLLKAFRKDNPGSVFSFSDNRWFTGAVYEKYGFINLGHTDPGYFWTKGRQRVPRYQTQKHRLKAMFPDCDPLTQTEAEIMHSRGFHRIWDCGNTRWLLQ